MKNDIENEKLARQVFHEKLNRVAVTPPAEAWDVIHQTLSAERKKRKRVYAWIGIPFLCVASFGMLYFTATDTASTHLNQQQKAKNSVQHHRFLSHEKHTHTAPQNINASEKLKSAPSLTQKELNVNAPETSAAASSNEKPALAHNSIVRRSVKQALDYIPKARLGETNKQVFAASQTSDSDSNVNQLPALSLLPLSRLSSALVVTLAPTNAKVSNTKHRTFLHNWSAEILLGTGYNARKINGNFDSQHLNTKDIIPQRVLINNHQVGLQMAYTVNNTLSVETGIHVGKNTFESTWFSKEIEDKTDDDTYEFSTIDGRLKIASTALNPYFQSTNYDTLNVKLHYQSSYFNIPVLVRLSLPLFSSTIVSPYVRLGLAYEQELNKITSLEVQRYTLTENIRFIADNQHTKWNLNGVFAFGCSTRLTQHFQLNTELQYSNYFRAKFNGENLTIRATNFQFKMGLMYAF